MNTETLVVKIAADVAEFMTRIKGAENLFNNSVASMKSAATGLIASLGAGFTAAAFVTIVKDSINAAAKLNDLSIEAGMTVEALSGLASVGKYSDIGAEQIAQFANKLTRNLTAATEESAGTGKAIKALGLDIDGFAAMAPEQRIIAVAKALDTFQDGAEKSAIMMALFGKEGAALLPFMKDLAVVGEIQAKVTTAQAAAADNFSDNLTRLKSSGDAWKKELANGMIPALDLGVQAFVDVTNGSGGLREEVRRLAEDGSITQWTQNGIIGITYLMDVFSGLKAVVKTVGETLGAVAAAGADTFAGIGTAVSKALRGDFAGAYADMQAANQRANAIWTSLRSTVSDTWSEQTLGSKIRARIEEIKLAGQTADAIKPKLNIAGLNIRDGAGTGKADPQIRAYADLIATIHEKIAAQELEIQTGGQLTEAQKLELDIQKLVEKGTISRTQASSEEIRTLVKRLGILGQEKDAEERRKKAAEDLAAARKAELQSAVAETGSLQQQLTSLNQSTEAMGLTATAVAALDAARLRALATQKEKLATDAEEADGNITLADQYRRQTDLLRQLADGKQFAAAKQEQLDFWRSIDTTAHDVFVSVAENGVNAFQRIGKTIKAAVLDLIWQLTARKWLIQLGVSLGVPGASLAQTALGSASGASGIGGWISSLIGGTSDYEAGIAVADAALVEMGGTASTAAGAFSGLTQSISGFLDAIPGWGWALGGIAALIAGLDDSGTYHTGGIAQYSAKGGLQTSTTHGAYGTGFGGVDYGKEGTTFAATMAKGITGVLDMAAVRFGKQAGYQVATAFADDTSKDGAWGALRIAIGGKDVLNWDSSRTSKWAPREFADGEQGAKEYAAAVAVSVRDYLVTQTPQWADDMLNALGDAPTIDQLAETVTAINTVAQVFDNMGRFAGDFANLGEEAMADLVTAMGGAQAAASQLSFFMQNFYSASERNAITQAQVEEQFAQLGITTIPHTREEFKALALSIDKSTESGRALFAALMALAPAFASYTAEVEDATTRVATIAGDIANAVNAAQQQAQAQAQEARNNALTALRTAVEREKGIHQTALQNWQTLASEASSVLNTIADAIRSLLDDALGTQWSASQGAAYISQALAAAKATGALPDQDKLSNAITAAQRGLVRENFTSEAERRYATLKLAAELQDLQAIAGNQYTSAEQQIDLEKQQLQTLDDTLAYYQQAMSGSTSATLSVADAVKQMQVVLDATLTTGFESVATAQKTTLIQQLAKVAQQFAPTTTAGAISQLATSISAGTIGISDAVNYMAGTPTESAFYKQHVTQGGATPAAYYAMLRMNGDDLIARGIVGEEAAQTLISWGVSLTDVARAYNITAAEVAANLLSGGAKHLPQLSIGTSRVLSDGLAVLHRDEAVVPAAEVSPWVDAAVAAPSRADTYQAATVGWLQSMDARLADIQKSTADTATASTSLASMWQRLTTGSALRTTAV